MLALLWIRAPKNEGSTDSRIKHSRPAMAASPTSRAAPLTGPARRALKKKRRFLGVIGVLTAGLLFELGLRPFVADTYHPGPFPVRTIRNYYEGLAVAHFEPDGLGQLGNRLTGNQPVSGAPEV